MCEVIDKYRYFSDFPVNAGSACSGTPPNLIEYANCGKKQHLRTLAAEVSVHGIIPHLVQKSICYRMRVEQNFRAVYPWVL